MKLLLLPFLLLLLIAVGCKKEGCTDPEAHNYWKHANQDDGSCFYQGYVIFTQSNFVSRKPTVVQFSTMSEVIYDYSNVGPWACFDVPNCTYAYFQHDPAESVPYTAKSIDGTTWSGTVSFTKNQLSRVHLD